MATPPPRSGGIHGRGARIAVPGGCRRRVAATLGGWARRPAAGPAAVAILAAAAYLRTLSPGALGGDAGEMQFVPYILSLTHPTGYPLQTLLGKLWTTVLPVGSVAWRMNALSAVAAAAGAALLCRTVTFLTRSRWSGLGAGALLAAGEVYWGQAVSADKYALGALLVSALAWALVAWLRRGTRGRLLALALVTGLGLAHHRSMALFVPLVGANVLWRYRAIPRRDLLAAAACTCAPLLLYLWLPIGASRGLPPGAWQPRSLPEWLGYLADAGYVEQIRPLADLSTKLGVYSERLVRQFGMAGAGLGLVGLACQVRRREAALPFLALGFAAQVVLAAGYEVPRHWVFFLPSFVLWAVWIGEGLAALERAGRALAPDRWARHTPVAPSITLGVALVCLALVAPASYRAHRDARLSGGTLDLWRQDLKAGYLAERFARLALAHVEPAAIIAADWEQATPLWYYQQVEGLRPDVEVRYPIDRWQEALETGRPTYVTRNVPAMDAGVHLSAMGPLVRVAPGPASEPPPDAAPLGVAWQEGPELVAYTLHDLGSPATDRLAPVSVYLRLPAATARDYSFSLRLDAGGGEQVWAEDRSALALGMYPTSRWVAGEVVGDYWEVPLPADGSEGEYRLALIIYVTEPDGGWRNLRLADTGEDLAIICSFPPAE